MTSWLVEAVRILGWSMVAVSGGFLAGVLSVHVSDVVRLRAHIDVLYTAGDRTKATVLVRPSWLGWALGARKRVLLIHKGQTDSRATWWFYDVSDRAVPRYVVRAMECVRAPDDLTIDTVEAAFKLGGSDAAREVAGRR